MHASDLDHQTTRSLLDAALAAAENQGVPVAVSIVDRGGHLLGFLRMSGVSFLAVEVTRRKAVTAAGFGFPTRALAAIAASDPSVGGDLAKNADLCAVGGGVPIILGGVCVGGIGVGGGRAEQDHAVAEAAVAYLRQPGA